MVGAITSGRYIAEDTKSNPKQSKPYQLLWSHYSYFL